MTILGIDPGYDRLGWAVVQLAGGKTTLVASGCVQTSSKDTIYNRYRAIQQELEKVLATHHPQECGMENLFFANNAKTVMRVGEARGLVIACLLRHNVEVFDYTPLQIKSAITGNGRATKSEVHRMILRLTGREKLPKLDDEVDAIAAALCHSASRGIRRIV